MHTPYIVDTADADFYIDCGITTPIIDVDFVVTHYANWGGYTGLADMKAQWVDAPERRKIHSTRMKNQWATGAIRAHVTTPELRAARSANMKAAWAAGKYKNRKAPK